MKGSAKFKMLMAAAGSLLWPAWAPGESRVASDPPHSSSQLEAATARLLFKIVIPEELSMEIADGQRAGAQEMIVAGDDRRPRPVSIMGADAESTRVLLSTIGRHSVAQLARCVQSPSADAAPRLSCTVSMP
jgi:hypothetical protein